jgi:uncharacterized damage-inducible protein DinB
MTTLDRIRNLWKHAAHTDAALFDALRNDDETSADARRELAHVVGAEEVWLSRLEGRESRSAVWPDASPAAIEQNVQTTHRGFDSYLSTLKDADLDATVTYTNSAGRTFTDAVGDILLHVALHGQYHRGRINLLLRQAGRTPVPADYIAFVRGAPSATNR